MHEIEIKFLVTSLQHVAHALAALGCSLTAPYTHTDTVFAQYTGSLTDFLTRNEVYVRIREESTGLFTLTAKKPLRRDMLFKQEVEVQVDDVQKTASILEMMGFKKAVTLKKTRQTVKHGQISICLDEVENLGSFVELEILGEEDNSSFKRLYEFAEQIGLKEQDEITEGYDILLMRKRETTA